MYPHRLRLFTVGTGAVVLSACLAVSITGCGSVDGTWPLGPGATVQSNTVFLTGVVLDTRMSPLGGVTVTVKGQSTVTNAQGQYSLGLIPDRYYSLTVTSGTTKILGPLTMQLLLLPDGAVVAPMVAQTVAPTSPTTQLVTDAQAAAGATVVVPGELSQTPALTAVIPAGAAPAGAQLSITNAVDSSAGLPGQLTTPALQARNGEVVPLGAALVDAASLSKPITLVFDVGTQFAGQDLDLMLLSPNTGLYKSAGRGRAAVNPDGTVQTAITTPGFYLLGYPATVTMNAETLTGSVAYPLPAATTMTSLEPLGYKWRSDVTFEGTVSETARNGVQQVIRDLSRRSSGKPPHMPLATFFGADLPVTGMYRTPVGGASGLEIATYQVPITVTQTTRATLSLPALVKYDDPRVFDVVSHLQGGGS